MSNKKNLNIELDELLADTLLPTDEQLKEDTKAEKVSISRKSQKATAKTKLILSKAKIGHKRSNASVTKSIIGSTQTKWLQLLEKYPLEQIQKVQEKNGNQQANTCSELGISFLSYKKLCKHYNIEKKKSNEEKQEYAKTQQAQPILVWKSSKQKPYVKIGKPKEYYGVTFCCNSFEPKLHKGNMLNNLTKGTPYRGMFFEYKK
jgi:hypothetical protein